MNRAYSITKSIDWFFVLSIFTSFTLGSVIARESGKPWNMVTFICGLGIVYALYLLERIYFFLSTSRVNIFTTVGRSQKLKEPLVIGLILGCFSVIFIGLFLLTREQVLIGINLIWLLGITILMMIPVGQVGRIWSMPNIWILQALIVSPLVIFLGSSLQEAPPLPLVSLLAVHLFLLYSASAVTLEFPKYQADLERGNRSFLIAVGWEKTIEVHNIVLILAYVTLGFYIYLSGSWSINWPTIGMIFVSILEVYQLRRIAEGLKPNWPLLNLLAIFQFNGMVYFLIYSLLIH